METLALAARRLPRGRPACSLAGGGGHLWPFRPGRLRRGRICSGERRGGRIHAILRSEHLVRTAKSAWISARAFRAESIVAGSQLSDRGIAAHFLAAFS